MQTAAILLIGNEILSGKIRDENASWLAVRLRALGVNLRRICVVPDEPDAIVDELLRIHATVDHVFTSGGVGPTHDDVTMDSVARAFGVEVIDHPELAALIRSFYGEGTLAGHLRMARVPDGTVLVAGGDIRWPVCQFQNVYILPGVPQLFRAKFDAIADRFREGAFYLRSVFLDADEGSVVDVLRDLEHRFPVAVGSYPRFGDPDHRIRVTIEARAAAPVDAAVDALVAALPPAIVLRVEAPVGQRLDEK
ncbi:MAG: competence/damage-inducible protein A [Myxococcales bacterium]|nr:competence/damage-inducible protein A [Myxococcales bacterium]